MDAGLNGYQGTTPAIGLVDPKFPHNVGAAVRAASCYGIGQVWFSGDRVRLDASKKYRCDGMPSRSSNSSTRTMRCTCSARRTGHSTGRSSPAATASSSSRPGTALTSRPPFTRSFKRVRAGLEVPNVTADVGDFDEPDHLADAVGVTWGR
jgi:hypothetical protein